MSVMAMILLPIIGMFLFAVGSGVAVGTLIGHERAGYIMAASVMVAGVAMIVPLWM